MCGTARLIVLAPLHTGLGDVCRTFHPIVSSQFHLAVARNIEGLDHHVDLSTRIARHSALRPHVIIGKSLAAYPVARLLVDVIIEIRVPLARSTLPVFEVRRVLAG